MRKEEFWYISRIIQKLGKSEMGAALLRVVHVDHRPRPYTGTCCRSEPSPHKCPACYQRWLRKLVPGEPTRVSKMMMLRARSIIKRLCELAYPPTEHAFRRCDLIHALRLVGGARTCPPAHFQLRTARALARAIFAARCCSLEHLETVVSAFHAEWQPTGWQPPAISPSPTYNVGGFDEVL